MRYLAADVYWFLDHAGCIYEGDRYPSGQAWLSPGSQVFFLPDPDEDEDGIHWFDADVIDDNLKDRWLPLDVRASVRRYP